MTYEELTNEQKCKFIVIMMKSKRMKNSMRYLKALEQRSKGKTFREIGITLGVSKMRASQMVKCVRYRLQELKDKKLI